MKIPAAGTVAGTGPSDAALVNAATSADTADGPDACQLRGPRPAPCLVFGAACGLTWAAALRAWMEQLAAGSGGSEFTWLTVALLLLPGTVLGGLLGWSFHLRANGSRPPSALIWSPAILAVAIADPTIFRSLVTTGQGGGSLMVVLTALAAGRALAGRRLTILRALAAPVAAIGLAALAAIGTMAAPAGSPRGAWVCLLGFALVLLLCLASTLPYPPTPRMPRVGWHVAGGALVGFAWAAALRGFMADLAGADSVVHWGDTFGLILAPGVVAGALLGWARYLYRTGGGTRWRWLVLAPLAFCAVVIKDVLTTGTQSIDTAPIEIALLGIAGSYALSGRGPGWSRALTGATVIGAVAVPLAIAAGPDHSFAVGNPHGLWVVTLIGGLITVLALGTSIPLRIRADRSGAPRRR